MNRLIRQADAVIIPSSDASARWIRVAGLSSDQVSVIPTGIDTTKYCPSSDIDRAEQRRALGLDPDVPMILYAGRIEETKGVAHLVDAFRCMSQRTNLVVCGAGVESAFVNELKRRSRDLGVIWLERRLNVTPLLAAADLVAVPSVVFETQGMVAIEAMSCGTPVVASAVGGLPETLTGFPNHLVAPGDPAALAGVLDQLVGWRQHSPTLGDDSRRWVVDHLASEHTVSLVSTLLSTLTT
jgi:starch synthase